MRLNLQNASFFLDHKSSNSQGLSRKNIEHKIVTIPSQIESTLTSFICPLYKLFPYPEIVSLSTLIPCNAVRQPGGVVL